MGKPSFWRKASGPLLTLGTATIDKLISRYNKSKKNNGTTKYEPKRAGKRRVVQRKMRRKASRWSNNSGPTNARLVRAKHKKGMSIKKKKYVKVPSKLKAQVKQVIAGEKPKGFFKETHQGLIDIDPTSNLFGYGIAQTAPVDLNFTVNKQWVFGTTSNAFWNFCHWTFNEILDAAAVLFYNKINKLHNTPFETNDEVNFIQNYEARHTDWPVPYLNTIANGLLDTPFTVCNSNITYEFLNNTHHYYEVEILKCSPKKLKAEQSSTIPAIYDWNNALLYENQGQDLTTANVVYPGGVERIGIAGQNNRAAANLLCTNQFGHSINEFGLSPTQSPMWNSEWKAGSVKFTLEPGQRYKLYCQGPKNVKFDAKKWTLNRQPGVTTGHEGLASNFAYMKPHWSEEHIFIIRPINRPAGTGQALVYPEVVPAATPTLHATAIAIQCTKSYTIEMPETAGTIFDNAPNPAFTDKQLPMANRKRSYYYNYWRHDNIAPDYTAAEQVFPGDPAEDHQEDNE